MFDDTTPLVEGLSIDEAFLDVGGLRRVAGTPVEIADAAARARCSSEVGLPITVGVARTKFLAKVASGVAKPDGLLVVPPDGEIEFLHPLPVERLWGVGPDDRAQAARAGHRDGRRGGPPRRGRPGGDARPGSGSPPARAGPQPRSPSGDGRPAAAARSARSARSGRAADVAADIDAIARRAWSTGSPAACAPPTGSGARSCCACASTTSPGSPARTRLPRPPRDTPTILAAVRDSAGRGGADDRASGASRWSASRSPISTTTAPCSSRCRSTLSPAARSTTALDGVRDRFGSPPITRAVLLGRDPGSVGADAARLTGAGPHPDDGAGAAPVDQEGSPT